MENSIEHNSKEYFEKQSEYWFNECCKRMKERDELINDIADIKRKAEAFDEIKVNLYHVKDLKPWETLDPKDHEFLRDIFNEIPSDWEADH
ncbi:hypothetical protein GBL60_10560 [Streptococcus equi]|nr:hypothetical protein [Streptococcus equi]NCA41700.1 hypothetical protein [Streptococcus equi]